MFVVEKQNVQNRFHPTKTEISKRFRLKYRLRAFYDSPASVFACRSHIIPFTFDSDDAFVDLSLNSCSRWSNALSNQFLIVFTRSLLLLGRREHNEKDCFGQIKN